MEQGELEEDEVVAQIMGAADPNSLTDVQKRYKDKVKAQIAKKAADLESQSGAGAEEYEYGTQLYARGRYAESERVLQKALDIAGPFGKLGGHIQIQLALALSANGKDQECIDMLRSVEQAHPADRIQAQARQLAFIMEAPKLEVREEERVAVPELSRLEDNIKEKKTMSFEEEFWENYRPPKYLTNKYVWAAASVLAVLTAYYSYLYKDCAILW